MSTNFLHWEVDAGPENFVEVTLDKQANVLLLDPSNYEKYRRGEKYSYFGGLVKASPFRLQPPRRGTWHLVVNLGGQGGIVRASAKVS